MMLGQYCLAELRHANPYLREAEGIYYREWGYTDFGRLPCGGDLDRAKEILLADLPEAARPLVSWEGEL